MDVLVSERVISCSCVHEDGHDIATLALLGSDKVLILCLRSFIRCKGLVFAKAIQLSHGLHLAFGSGEMNSESRRALCDGIGKKMVGRTDLNTESATDVV